MTALMAQTIEDTRLMAREAADFIRAQASCAPRVAIVCGTGMGGLADCVENAVTLPYTDIPHFPVSTVQSHSGRLILGNLGEVPVALMQGRFHVYEGYEMQELALPFRALKGCGCDTLLTTCAAGGMNPIMPLGALVLIDDHIDFFMGQNPMVGPNDDELGVRFPDMSAPYDPSLIALGEEVARQARIAVWRGIYLGGTGPTFETRAEYRMFRRYGADLVGMSTVPEVLTARHCGMRVLGIATVTNLCRPDAPEEPGHEGVIDVAQSAGPRLQALVRGILSRLNEVS
ncbi:MAG: purine-nucleoside phosphorylase [Candidatus Sumerlaeia bacterium]